jgi:hypothetical protein
VNIADPISFFSDGVFHLKCLQNHSFGKKAIELVKMHYAKGKPAEQLCFIGHNRIASYKDYVYSGLLTSDPSEELYRFNFIAFDRNNIPNWKDRDKFVNELKKLRGAEPGFEYLIKAFEK